MANTDYFGSGNLTSTAGMTTTTHFEDVATDDTTTIEKVSAAWSYNFGTTVTANSQITALKTFGSLVNLTAWRFTAKPDPTASPDFAFGGFSIANSASYLVEYYDGAVWQSLASGALTVGLPAPGPFQTKSGTTNVTASQLRVYISYSFGWNFPGHSGSGTADSSISDFRATTTSSAVPVSLTASGTFSMTGGSRPTQQARTVAAFSFSTTVLALFHKCRSVFLSWVGSSRTNYTSMPGETTVYSGEECGTTDYADAPSPATDYTD